MERRSTSLNAFEKFKVVLRDENGKPRLDENNEPITVIATHLDMLDGKTFLTHADEHGENGQIQVLVNHYLSLECK